MFVKLICPKCKSDNVIPVYDIEDTWVCYDCKFQSGPKDFIQEDISYKWPEGVNKYEGIEENIDDSPLVSASKAALRALVDAGFSPYIYQPYVPLHVTSPLEKYEKPL